MVTIDSRFVLDCATGVPSAVGRYLELQGRREPLYLSVAARAQIVAHAADRDVAFRRRVETLLGSTESVDIDPESVRCAAEIAQELARSGRRLDAVDLFVAAEARRHGQSVLSRNPSFGTVPGLVCQSY